MGFAARPRGGVEMPTFRIEDEEGRWLTDMRLNAPNWKPGDRILHGHDTLQVVEVRDAPGAEKPVLVVRVGCSKSH